MTQAEMGNLLHVKPNYISMLERGDREPSRRLEQLFDNLENERHTVTSLVKENSPAYSKSVTPRSALKAAREAKGMSQKDLAKATGYGVGYIQALEDGGARISESFVDKVAPVLGLDKEFLMSGSDVPQVLGGTSGTMGATPDIKVFGDMKVRFVPLISWSQAGQLTDYMDEVYEHEAVVAFDIKDPKAFAVTIRGDSMSPQFNEGAIAILSPSTQAQTGNLVVARIADQGVVFKRFQRAGKRLQFISVNPAYPMLEFDESEVAWVYPVKSVMVNTL